MLLTILFGFFLFLIVIALFVSLPYWMQQHQWKKKVEDYHRRLESDNEQSSVTSELQPVR